MKGSVHPAVLLILLQLRIDQYLGLFSGHCSSVLDDSRHGGLRRLVRLDCKEGKR
jgi:hypothetical protein